jgi:cytochrome P450
MVALELCCVLVIGAAALFILLMLPPWAWLSRDRDIPVAPVSIWHAVSRLLDEREDCDFILGVARALSTQAGEPVGIFRLPYPQRAPFYIVCDTAIAKAVLTEPSADKGALYAAYDGATGGVASIFTRSTHDPKWRLARKGAAPAFSAEHVGRMERECLATLRRWIDAVLLPAACARAPLDVCAEMLRVTVDAICKSALAYEPGAEEVAEFLSDLDMTTRELTMQFVVPVRKHLGWALPAVRRSERAAGRLFLFARRILEAYRAQPAEARVPATIVALIDANSGYASDDERCADLLVFLIAGHDTTAFSIAWTLCELATHPDEQAALRAALREAAEPTRAPELAAVLRESMRLNPVAALGSARTAGRDFALPNGVTLRKGSDFVVANYAAHRNAAHLDAPDEFRPARWAQIRDPSQVSIPFSLGARNCVGQALANVELSAVVAELCARFDFEMHTPPTPTNTLTRKPTGALLLAKLCDDVAA